MKDNMCDYVIINSNDQIIDQSDCFSDEYVEVRSCAKPFQMLPIYGLGLVQKHDLSDADIALLSSSSFAQNIHVQTIQALLK